MGPDIRICFIGDSFTAGVGDPEVLGWVGRLVEPALAAGHNLTTYNLGVRRETSGDIRKRWRREVEPRCMAGSEMRLVFCFGANDASFADGKRRLTLDETLRNARAILEEASAIWPCVLIGPPPVADAAHDERIAEMSTALLALATEVGVPCLDVFGPLMTRGVWRAEATANDGSHPRAAGYSELADLVRAWDRWWFSVQSVR